MIQVLVVEDDLELLNLFKTVLINEGYEVHAAENGEVALEIMDNQDIDLVITDVMMPRVDGFEFVSYLRALNSMTPVLFITALGSFADKRKGFKLGIDDYMVKPIDVNEMVLRVEALLRRSKVTQERKLKIGNTSLSQDTLLVKSDLEVLELPNKEFQLLWMLLSSVNKIFTRRQIFEAIWGVDSDTHIHTLDVHINRLRTKLKNNQDFQILTVRGLGYKAVLVDEER